MGRTGLSDTSPEARRVLDEAFRAMAPSRKLRLMAQNYRSLRWLHEAGARGRDRDATPADIRRSWNATTLGAGPWDSLATEGVMGLPTENLDDVLAVAAAFDALGIAYALGGSWASAYYGEPRSTQDADFTAEPFPGKEEPFAARFGPDYYVSPDAIKQAIRARRTFNVINVAAGFKADVFISTGSEFDASVMRRRAPITEPGDPEHPLVMVSPEDIILRKLEWYRLGGESSERQWLDILGVLRIQAGRLDDAYLDRWAAGLGVADLLAEARRDAVV
jgi:hypothetical protein